MVKIISTTNEPTNFDGFYKKGKRVNTDIIRKKELMRQYNGAAVIDGEIKTFVEIRFYMGRGSNSSMVYCLCWMHYTKEHGTATFRYCAGSAGGYGYDKFSAALADALDNGGVTLESDISGRGESAIRGFIDGYADYIRDNHLVIMGKHTTIEANA